ncbi:MAG: hypothetical protein ABIX12_14495 [Rubrivivax sp.]
MELPVKTLLPGADAACVMHRDAMVNADGVDGYVALARERAAPQPADFSLPPD